MAYTMTSRVFQKTCTKTIFGLTRTANGLQKTPVQLLASFSANQKWNEPCNNSLLTTQKFNISAPVVKRVASTDALQGHDHVKHWTAEKLLTIAMMGTIPSAVIWPSTMIENFLAVSICVHAHWGLDAIVIDYIRPSVFGNIIPKVARGAVFGFTILTLGGLLYFIYTDVGLVNAVRLLWKL